jgi:hypothetical protein
MSKKLAVLCCVLAFSAGYWLIGGTVVAQHAEIGTPGPSGSTSGGGGVIFPWYTPPQPPPVGTRTLGGTDAYGINRPPEPGEPGYDPNNPPDFAAILGYQNAETASFENLFSVKARTDGAQNIDVRWRTTYILQGICHVRTINAPGSMIDQTMYAATAALVGWVHFAPDPEPKPDPDTGSPYYWTHHPPVLEIVNDVSGQLNSHLNLATAPNTYREVIGVGGTHEVQLEYGVGGFIELHAFRQEVEVGAYTKVDSVSVVIAAWNHSGSAPVVMSKQDGTDAVWSFK